MKIYLSQGRYICKSTETYKGTRWECRGTSKKSKADARESWRRAREKKKRRIDGETARGCMRLGDDLEAWYDLYKLRDGRSERTQITDTDTIRQIQGSWLGRMRLDDITADDVQRYLLDQAAGQMGSALRRKYLMLRMYYRNRGGENPLARCVLPAPGVTPARKRAYTAEEIARLTDYLLQPRVPGVSGMVYGPALSVCLHAFLRCGELCGLHVGDVELESSVIHVRRQWSDKVCREVPPKYGSARDVPISGAIRHTLEEAVQGRAPEEILFPTGTWNPRSASSDRHMRERVLLDALTRAERHLGLEHHTLHDLRHDGITRLVDIGVKPQSVSRWAGHKSLTMTLDRYYRHSGQEDPEDLKKIREN